MAHDADNEYAMIKSTIVGPHQHSAGPKGVEPSTEAIGGSKGGLTTKIHAVVDALGNPLSFHLTLRQVCNLDGSDQLLPNIVTDTVLADKGYDADERVIERLQAQGKTAVFPPSVTLITVVTTTRIYTKPVT